VWLNNDVWQRRYDRYPGPTRSEALCIAVLRVIGVTAKESRVNAIFFLVAARNNSIYAFLIFDRLI
jgi:hypothetical protein